MFHIERDARHQYARSQQSVNTSWSDLPPRIQRALFAESEKVLHSYAKWQDQLVQDLVEDF